LAHLDAAYNLAGWLMRDDYAAETWFRKRSCVRLSSSEASGAGTARPGAFSRETLKRLAQAIEW